MFERPQGGEIAILVNIALPHTQHPQDDSIEFHELALAAGAQPAAFIIGSRLQPEPKYFVGSGKAEEIRQAVTAHKAELVLFNHALSPAQERNLEKLFQCRVLDRTGLILDIFAQRARTFEGKLQVELAQLQHISTRLVRGWTHLERQRGGIGLRGPGETQLETDRRLIRHRIKTISQRLEKVRQQRSQNRRARQKSELPTVSLVGYTNAGKSTLFNRLTDADVYVANQPFATLDPTLRRYQLPNGQPLVFADTVGFIQNLPHDLVESFRATLEETREADLLLHVVDAHHVNKNTNIAEVEKVLTQIGADAVSSLLVYNKIDLLADTEPRIDRNQTGKPYRVWISASNNLGIDLLKQAIEELLSENIVEHQLILTATESRLRAQLYKLGAVQNEHIDNEGNSHLTIHIHKADFARLLSNK